MESFWLITVVAVVLFGGLGWSLYRQENAVAPIDTDVPLEQNKLSSSAVPEYEKPISRHVGWGFMAAGFLIGSSLAVGFEFLFVGLANVLFDVTFTPRGPGWIVFVFACGVASARFSLSLAQRVTLTNPAIKIPHDLTAQATIFLATIGRSDAWRGTAILAILVVAMIVLVVTFS